MWWLSLMLFYGAAALSRDCHDATALHIKGGHAPPLPSWSTAPLSACPHAVAMHAISLIGQGDLHAARKVLLISKTIDWVAEQHLGAAAERIARALYASGAGDDRIALAAAARHFRRALEGWDSASPHAALAQPLTVTVRAYGQVLLWLGNVSEAREVFKNKQVGWATPWARPTVAHRLRAGSPAPFGRLSILKVFEDALPWITAEAKVVDATKKNYWRPEAAGLHANKSWNVLVLTVNGKEGDGCWTMPRTCALLREGAATPLTFVRDGQAKLSRMRRGTAVRPHAGPSNARLRMHCALWVFRDGPDAAALRVGETTVVKWREGRCFLFDESYEHEVTTTALSKDDDDTRMVLIVDLANPFLASLDAFREFGVSQEGWMLHRGALEGAWHEAGAGAGEDEL